MKFNQILVGRVALGLLLLSTAPACDVLTQDVPTALTPDDTFSSATRIDKAALGMYDALQNPEFYGGRVLIYGDFRSDDVDPPTTFFGNIVTFNATADNAIAANADVFITADFKYHDFFDADSKLVVADVGHYESEQFTKELLLQHLSEKFPILAARISSVNTNPIKYL